MAVLGFTPLELRTYFILTLCWLSIVVVQILEQPYARSLVVCETPTNTTPGAPFSGSKYCGDRLHVINVGTEFSGKGQSLENIGRICITLFVSGFADGGRRRAVILGQFLIFFSTLLFFLAGFVSSYAIPIYIVAQWIQGMSGIGILDQIITGDVALLTGDSVGVYNRKNTFLAVMIFVFFPVVAYVQYAEFADFTYVWLAVNILNFSALVLLIVFFPETISAEQKQQDVGVLQVVTGELRTFWELISSNLLIRYRLFEQFLLGLGDATSILLPHLMAVFGTSQFMALVLGFGPGMLLSPFFMPLAPFLHRRLGYWNAWRLHYCYTKFAHISFLLGVPGLCYPMLQQFMGIPGPIALGLFQIPICGWGTIISAVEIRMIGQKNNAKYQAMTQLVSFVTQAVSSVMYSKAFDAEATTNFGKNLPYYVAVVWALLTLPGFFLHQGPLHREECDKLEKEEAAKAQEGPSADDASANGAKADVPTDGEPAADKKKD